MQNRFLHTEKLSIGYGKKELLSKVDLEICEGEMVCLVGPNGVGKTTLIKALTGMLDPLEGEVYIKNELLREQTLRQLACKISIVLTQKMTPANLTVYDLVAMGRTPHTNWLGHLTQKDRDVVQNSMELVNITQFANRQIESLSDGERQRTMIAKALAQDTPVIILDEPTAHLDVTNRVALLSLLKSLAKDTNKSILLSTHELEMAIQVADKIWLINNDNQLKVGTPEDLAIEGIFEDTFKGEHIKFDLNTGTFKMQYKYGKKVALEAEQGHNKALYFWTKQALEKEGFEIVLEGDSPLKVSFGKKEAPWIISTSGKEMLSDSIEELLIKLRQEIQLGVIEEME